MGKCNADVVELFKAFKNAWASTLIVKCLIFLKQKHDNSSSENWNFYDSF